MMTKSYRILKRKNATCKFFYISNVDMANYPFIFLVLTAFLIKSTATTWNLDVQRNNKGATQLVSTTKYCKLTPLIATKWLFFQKLFGFLFFRKLNTCKICKLIFLGDAKLQEHYDIVHPKENQRCPMKGCNALKSQFANFDDHLSNHWYCPSILQRLVDIPKNSYA